MLGSAEGLLSERIEEGWRTPIGEIEVGSLSLPGHTPGGIGYTAPGVVFSGDALFAGSLGGAQGAAYGGQIEAVGRKVLSLPGDTRIFPGHGPMTTVAEERAHNPFYR
jgi:glyoxylase-like metal-dependent hydrolase (beta-lactamase superfamily II)